MRLRSTGADMTRMSVGGASSALTRGDSIFGEPSRGEEGAVCPAPRNSAAQGVEIDRASALPRLLLTPNAARLPERELRSAATASDFACAAIFSSSDGTSTSSRTTSIIGRLVRSNRRIDEQTKEQG